MSNIFIRFARVPTEAELKRRGFIEKDNQNYWQKFVKKGKKKTKK